ncbi:MAG TPA: LON peptidase substrate-binding domain-containing protein, partial [Chloroflexota bacterium]|nr:LON peptidase substrate-binding domain-containing protein [Chloroflexota bacterium]
MATKEQPKPDDSAEPKLERLPVVPLFDLIVFPRMMAPLQVSRKTSLQAVEAAVKTKPQRIVLVTQTDSEKHDVSPDDLMTMGVVATIGPMVRMPDGGVHLLAQGEYRVRLLNYTQTEPYLEVEFTPIEDKVESSLELTALMDQLKEMITKYVQLRGNVPADPLSPSSIREISDPGYLADLVALLPELESDERRELFLQLDVQERLRLSSQLLNKQVEMLDLKTRISSEVQKNIDKTQREYLLREQMKEIQRELGELDAEAAEAE